MASTFKTLSQNDSVSTKTLLHEAIPLTGTIVSGTYDDANVKNYGHGMFQSVYDYPYLSSSANHIFDISFGYSSQSALSASSGVVQQDKKINLYNQMAQILVGYDKNGNIKRFDSDGDFIGTTTDKIDECVFLNFSRLLYKDEIKKGSFEMKIMVSGGFAYPVGAELLTISDHTASTDGSYFVNSPAGEYGILSVTASTYGTGETTHTSDQPILATNGYYSVGLIYYQAGIVVLSGSLFNDENMGGILNNTVGHVQYGNGEDKTFSGVLSGSTIETAADHFRQRLYNIQFNNTVELNSTIYFCRANHNEFNYSSNPTYLSGSAIRGKPETENDPVSYITTIGLYSSDNQLMAVGKLSEPLRKDPTIELTLRTRLDY